MKLATEIIQDEKKTIKKQRIVICIVCIALAFSGICNVYQYKKNSVCKQKIVLATYDSEQVSILTDTPTKTVKRRGKKCEDTRFCSSRNR